MRVVVAIPSVGLLAGTAIGLFVSGAFGASPDRALLAAQAVGLTRSGPVNTVVAVGPVAMLALAVLSALAVWAWRKSWPRVLACAIGLSFLVGGVLLGAHAWRQAWQPSLRVVFDELAAMEREQAESAGRVVPEELAVPTVIMGRLRTDASPRDVSVSLSVEVIAIDADARRPEVPSPPEGSRRPELVDGAKNDRRGPELPRRPRDAPRGPNLSARMQDDSRRPELLARAPQALSTRVALCSRQVRGGVLLTVVGDLAHERIRDWRAGRLIRAPVALHRPSRYLNPGAVDEERALARRGTILVGTVKSGALVEVVALGSPWAEAAARARALARRSVAAAVGGWSVRASAIVTAIVIGDRAGLSEEVQRTLQEAGTYHVIAISGGNIAILAGLTLGAFRIAGMLGRGAMLSAIAGLLAYAYLVGGGASVDRATLMAVVYFAGRAIDLRGSSFNGLMLVAAVLVAADPLAIADPSFLLTFGATSAILAVAARKPISPMPFPLAALAGMLTASVAAEAALFPVGAMVFSRVTVAGLLLNFAAIPLMAVAQIAGMLVVPVSMMWPSGASWIGWIAFAGAEGLVRSAGLVTLAPFLTWRVAPPSWLAVAAYYVALVVVWMSFAYEDLRGAPRASGDYLTARAEARAYARRRVGRLAAAAATALARSLRVVSLSTCAACAIWILFQPWTVLRSHGDGRLQVTFIDVGQGDAAFVRFPRGATLVVDAGGSGGRSAFDVGDRVVAPVLRRAGVRRLDTIALTHGDADHVGGADALIGEFRPRDVWEGIPVPPFEPLRRLRTAARAVGARWTNLQAADVMTIDEVDVVVRHPGIADWERQDVRNDDSIVIELRWEDASIVLTGDIGREVEQAIAPLFPASPLRVIKVPHHGSLTSSSLEFLRALAPRVAVVSAGRSNPFGHPAPAVLARYREVGAEIFRTDRDGAVTLTTDGHLLQLETFSGRHLSVSATASASAPAGHEDPKDTKP